MARVDLRGGARDRPHPERTLTQNQAMPAERVRFGAETATERQVSGEQIDKPTGSKPEPTGHGITAKCQGWVGRR